MRLTILNQFYVPDISPTAHLTASLAEDRAARGDDVTVVTSRGGYVGVDGREGADQAAGIRVHRIWTPRLGKGSKLKRIIDYGFFYLGAAVRLLTMPGQHVIVSLTTPPMIAWAAVLHKTLHPECRLILWNMDCYPEVGERTGVIPQGGVVSRAMRRANKALFDRLDHLVVLDTAMKDLLMDAYAPEGRELPVTIVPNWERRSLFPASEPRRDSRDEQTSAPAGLPDLSGQFVVLYLGNTGYGHAFDTVLDAADQLRDEAVTFLFVGGGSRWGEIQTQTQQRGLTNVVLHGYVPKEQTPAVMRAADAALITLRDDALGVMSPSKLHSNLAMGLPVLYVGPAGSNVDDAIARFGCGVSVRHGDAARLVTFIRDLRQRADEQTRLAQAARNAFEEGYCDTVTLPQFDGILSAVMREQAAEKPPAPDAAEDVSGRREAI